MEKEFCLIDEPWIKVLNNEAKTVEVSLKELFCNAHLYRRLAGETDTQDAAIFRLLLAITITVFYRYDVDGNPDDVLDYEDAEEVVLDRWKDYRAKGRFNATVFENYLETYRERFYLFHPETPFYQVAGLEYGTDYGAFILLGNLKESKNEATRHHFAVTDGGYVENMEYSEVSRWLVFLNAYSVNVKTKVNGSSVATGVGRLGQLGHIIAEADSLFESIMINLCPLRNANNTWGEAKPIWEDKVKSLIGVRIAPPDNLAELYTLQSRRILLIREDRRITTVRMIGGDYYDVNNDPVEQMTLLKQVEDKKDKTEVVIVPKKHSSIVSAWREFPTLLSTNDKFKSGLVKWIECLIEHELICTAGLITFKMIGLEYDGMSYKYIETVSDNLSLSYNMLSQFGKKWITHITNQIEKCERVPKECFYSFAKNMADILGNSEKTSQIKGQLESSFYFRLDYMFREWLAAIDCSKDSIDEKEMEWEKKAKEETYKVVEEYLSNLSPHISVRSADVFRKFVIKLNKIYTVAGKEVNNE